MTQIHLGFAVGSGSAVEIPLGHTVVCGQTQHAGKTTALEALVSRSAGRTALAFITKRGESSFQSGRRIQPYFRDRADWQFVTSIIDATLQEKNKFLRPWIMRICRTTRSLADVQTAVRKALEKAKGINEGVYTQLDAYLDLIVPEIQRAQLAPSLDIAGRGLSVMDVGSFRSPMQMLFIQSALDFVNEHSENTIVVIPEAWEFIPESKGSPVKASAIALVRKGAGIGNYIWVDSQDTAGVDKEILRGCSVWLIGVQREANEIKRNLANIPASIKKPSAADVAMLEKGQFYACWGTHAVKTYVQPAWMDAAEARGIARGEVAMPAARWVPPRMPATPETPTEVHVTEAQARALQETNERLQRDNDDLRRRLEALERPKPIPAASGHYSLPAPASVPTEAPSKNGRSDDFALYEWIKERLINEAPGILKLITARPELVVEVERKVVTADGSTLKGRIVKLLANGFFKQAKRHSETKRELERTGSSVHGGNLATELGKLVKDGFMTDEGELGYAEVADMKVNIVER